MLSLGLGLLLISGCAYLGYLKDPFVDIPSFHQVDRRLYRGGQPTEAGFRELESVGIKTVISLRGKDEDLEKEKQKFEALGINFYNLPMTVYKRPDDKTVLSFLEIVLNKSNQPVFLHCASGRDRTGAMVAMYRVVVSGWDIKQAYKEAKQFGFWPYRGDIPELKNFVHQLKDKTIYYERAKELLNEEAK